jgi:hypothetical protein
MVTLCMTLMSHKNELLRTVKFKEKIMQNHNTVVVSLSAIYCHSPSVMFET